MPTGAELRRRHPDPLRRRFLNAADYPEIPWDEDHDYDEITLSYHESAVIAWRRFIANLGPDIQSFLENHPIINQVSWWTTLTTALLAALLFLFFHLNLEPRFVALSPWHVQRHNAWLHAHGILESTWILDEEALSHASNDPSLVDDILLQFPQRNGGSSVELRDVRFDPHAYYGVISMKKLEEDHVPMRIVFGIGEGVRPVMGIEVIGQDIVAMTWGGRGTYKLKAWTVSRCRWLCLRSWVPGRGLPGEIPAETMRELVDKHRTIPAAALDEPVTSWQQRTLDEEMDMAQERLKKDYVVFRV